MYIVDRNGNAIVDRPGYAIQDNANPRHRYVLDQLMPVSLGENQSNDMIIEGRHLDEIEDEASALVDEMFPDTASELISDWERLLGLPDPCTGTPDTIADRQLLATAKWGEKRQLSLSYLVSVAELLGVTVTIENYAARRYGQAVLGGPYNGRKWSNTITVHASGLGTDQRQQLECTFTRLRPANTFLNFDYT